MAHPTIGRPANPKPPDHDDHRDVDQARADSTALEPGPRAELQLRNASPEQPSLIDHRIRRRAKHDTPFVNRARNVKVGNAVAKSIYVTTATWCDVWNATNTGVCRPSLSTIRACTEWGKTAFMDGWRFLIKKGLVATRRGSGKKIVVVPRGGAVIEEVPPRGTSPGSAEIEEVPPRGTSRSTASRYMTVQGKEQYPSPAAAERPARAREADRRREQQQQRRQDRIEGLVGAIAARAREAGHSYDEADERRRLRDGEIDVDDLQRLADQLADEVHEKRMRRAHGPRYGR